MVTDGEPAWTRYSPLGESVLRTIFLKTDNDQNGQYLAELTQELFSDLEESKYTHTESACSPPSIRSQSLAVISFFLNTR